MAAANLAACLTVAQELTPEDAVRRMTVADGFDVSVVASEPLVRQPVCIEFDDRGRLWVIQYLQYPNPEGLKRVTVDRYSRTKYDRVPEPPPHGPRGADRITILTDADGDGRMDGGRDFVNGLNLTTGIAFGHGGVFVLNVPHLLFYPDRDRDDVPDTDPEVLLTGFGMEDAHSVANSLAFGPDGWLYGCQGSTVTAHIRGIEFQQGVWRYHPVTREFELFCEGGGNSWGLDFDATGRLFYSTNWGGHVLLHGVQGGYLVKAFAKHGELHNAHAYGFFDHAPHENFTGGHVTVGGIVYQGHLFPDSFRGKYIAGDLLGHGVYWHDILPRGSTVATRHGGTLIQANDPWFAPTDVATGPDGAVYVADWHDARTAHPDPDADWDRSNGRIYRIAPQQPKTQAGKSEALVAGIDFAKLTSDALLNLHSHRSQWFVRRARAELVRRGDTSVQDRLRRQAATATDQLAALESLWTLHALGSHPPRNYAQGGIGEELAFELLNSPHPAVRAWTVRLLGDRRSISEAMAHRLDEFAEQEASVDVRQQLACSAARFPANQALPMINANINRDMDSDDPLLPLLWWWAVERHSVTESDRPTGRVSGREEVMKRFVRPTLWKSQLGRDFLLPRLARRYAAEGRVEGLDCVVRLLNACPHDAARTALWPAVARGFADKPDQAGGKDSSRSNESTPRRPTQWGQATGVRDEIAKSHELFGLVTMERTRQPEDLSLLQLAILLGQSDAVSAALAGAGDSSLAADRRIKLLGLITNVMTDSMTNSVMQIAESDADETVRKAAVQAVSRQESGDLTARLIALHRSSRAESLRTEIRAVLLGRKSSALAWLKAVDRGDIRADETSLDQIRLAALHGDRELDVLVAKHWGRLTGATREEKLAEVRRLNNDLRAFPGDKTRGAELFRKHCAACHQLFGDGTKLGPDLTTANRADRDFLLVSLVDPSTVIRKEFVGVIVVTTDGRTVMGLAVSQDASGITIANPKNERTTIPATQIEEIRESEVSFMPDDLYRQLKPRDLRDLFAWLQSTGPPPSSRTSPASSPR